MIVTQKLIFRAVELCTVWTINDILVDLCPCYCIERPKQIRVWIDEDVIDGPGCTMRSVYFLNEI